MDDDCLFAASTLFDGYCDGTLDFTIDGVCVSVNCNTERGCVEAQCPALCRGVVNAWLPACSEDFQAQSGQCVWPAAEMLCEVCRTELHGLAAGAFVMELGCGVGLPSLFVGKRFPGTRLLLTDISPALLETTHSNLVLNGERAVCP